MHMPRTRQSHTTQVRVLAGMMLFSAACLLIHPVVPRWGDAINNRFRQLSQPVALLAAMTPKASPRTSLDMPDAASQSSIERTLAEGQILAMAEEVRTLRRQNAELMGLRANDYIPPRLGRLIPSDVISRDSLAYRRVDTINHGDNSGATLGQFVTSAIYLDRGSDDGLKLKRNVFALESLAGQIVWVGPYTSRVRLLTDPNSRIRVRVARIRPDAPQNPVGLSQDLYTLEGAGPDGMFIQQVDYRQVTSGAIKVGDLIVAEPSPDLPRQAMSLRRAGRIAAIQRGSTQVVCTLKVSPLADLNRLNHLYVFDPTPIE